MPETSSIKLASAYIKSKCIKQLLNIFRTIKKLVLEILK